MTSYTFKQLVLFSLRFTIITMHFCSNDYNFSSIIRVEFFWDRTSKVQFCQENVFWFGKLYSAYFRLLRRTVLSLILRFQCTVDQSYFSLACSTMLSRTVFLYTYIKCYLANWSTLIKHKRHNSHCFYWDKYSQCSFQLFLSIPPYILSFPLFQFCCFSSRFSPFRLLMDPVPVSTFVALQTSGFGADYDKLVEEKFFRHNATFTSFLQYTVRKLKLLAVYFADL